MSDLRKIIRPTNGVFLIAVGLFLFWSLVELSKLSTYSETPSDRNNYVLYLFRWPDDVAKKINNKYFEIRLLYDEQNYKRLSQQPNQRVTHELVANGPDYVMVYKHGKMYAILRFLNLLVFFSLLFLNFYLLALTIYWLGRGVKKALTK